MDNGIQANPAKHPEFANKEVRQALMYAIDRQAIIDNIYGGAASIVPCLYGLPNLTGSVEPHPYDPAKAKELVDGSRRRPRRAGRAHVRHLLRRSAVGQRHDRDRRRT